MPDDADNMVIAALTGKAQIDYYDKRPTPLRGHGPISACPQAYADLPRATKAMRDGESPEPGSRAATPAADIKSERPAAAGAGWFDPLEEAVRGKVRTFIEAIRWGPTGRPGTGAIYRPSRLCA